VRTTARTEKRTIATLDGRAEPWISRSSSVTSRREYRGDVANLSRNVSWNRGSRRRPRSYDVSQYSRARSRTPSSSFWEGGVLGRLQSPLPSRATRCAGRRSSARRSGIAANRWITIHGTNSWSCGTASLCSVGTLLHEDGTEVYNVLDRNLAVQAFIGKPLPKQVLALRQERRLGLLVGEQPNSFTRTPLRNATSRYFFQATKNATFDPVSTSAADGSRKGRRRAHPAVRALRRKRSHTQRRHARNLAAARRSRADRRGVGPDERSSLRRPQTPAMTCTWAFHPVSPSMPSDGMTIDNAELRDLRRLRAPCPTPSLARPRSASARSFPRRDQAKGDAVSLMTDDLPPTTVITSAIRLPDEAFVSGARPRTNGKNPSGEGQRRRRPAAGHDLSEWRRS